MSATAKPPAEPVLIVDDDAMVRQMVGDLATSAGFRPLLAATAEDARVLLVEEPIAALVDVTLPGMSGDAFCRALRADEATSMLPVLMMTAQDEEKVVQRCLVAGADDFIVKPVSKEELLAKLNAVRGGGQPGLPSRLKGKRVLLATENELFLSYVVRLLQNSSCEVDVVRNLDGLSRALAAKARPDVAVLDLDLVGPDGVGQVRRLEQHSNTPMPIIPMASSTSIRSRAPKWAAEAPRVWATLAPFDVDEERDEILRQLSRVLTLGGAKGNTRRKARVPFYASVRFQWVGDEGSGRHGIGFDLSETGIFVRTLAPLEPARKPVELAFRVGKSGTIHVKAVVVWANPCGPRNVSTMPFGMGLSFTDLPPDATKALNDHVVQRRQSLPGTDS